MKKNLSIYINFFKEIGIDFVKGRYNIINYSDTIYLNTKIFYNNLTNKNYFLLFILLTEKEEIDILGEYLIYDNENVRNKFKQLNLIPEEVGIFNGSIGEANFSIIKNLSIGNYELCCIGKIKEDNINLEELREQVKKYKTLKEFDNNFEIYASCPFSVIK